MGEAPRTGKLPSAMALEMYARQAQNVEAERKACEVRLRAERRAGELLKELARATPETARIVSHDGTRSPYAAALESTGMSRQTASRYQALAKPGRGDIRGCFTRTHAASEPAQANLFCRNRPTAHCKPGGLQSFSKSSLAPRSARPDAGVFCPLTA